MKNSFLTSLPSLTRGLFVGLAALALHGCAGVSQSSLTPVPNPTTIVLAQPFTWVEIHSAFGQEVTFEYTMAPGNYVGARRDRDGVFFEGKELCLTKKIVHSNSNDWPLGWTWRQRCGVYVANPGVTETKVYNYQLGSISQPPGQPESAPLGGVSASELARNAGNSAALAANVVANTHGVTPVQGGVAGGLGAGVGAALADMQAEARIVNAQFLFYQPKEQDLKAAFNLP